MFLHISIYIYIHISFSIAERGTYMPRYLLSAETSHLSWKHIRGHGAVVTNNCAGLKTGSVSKLKNAFQAVFHTVSKTAGALELVCFRIQGAFRETQDAK